MHVDMENITNMYTVPEDEYFNAAAQIFKKCGPICSELLPVETIMKVMAPFIGCKKSEYRYLYSIVDPEGSNPSISVKSLASALKEYSDKNNTIIYNNNCVSMGNGDALLDSPELSEGLHETSQLESELRERKHMMRKLQKQMEFTDRQHEEAISAITAERDELHAKLLAMREENTSLLILKEENREIHEWSLGIQQKLSESRLELNMLRKRTRTLQELVEKLELEKQSLNEMFLQTKEEYTRVSDIYSNRQTMLLEDNELLKGEMSELERRHNDQEQLIQQLLKDKEHLEIDLKDILNKSTRMDAPLGLDQSVDVSCTDASMLRALDSLNSDFTDEKNRIDFEPFPNILHKEDYGRPSNVSLYDELRSVDFDTELYSDTDTNSSKWRHEKSIEPFKTIEFSTFGCQTDSFNDIKNNCEPCKRETENNNNNLEKMVCAMCKEYAEQIVELKSEIGSEKNKIHQMQSKIDCYKENINALNYSIEHYEEKNKVYECDVESLNAKIYKLENKKSKKIIDVSTQTKSPELIEDLSQTEERDYDDLITPILIHIDNSTQTVSYDLEEYKTSEKKMETRELGTQTGTTQNGEGCIQNVISGTQDLCTQTEICETQDLCIQTEICETQDLCTQTEICETQDLCTQTEICETQEPFSQTESSETRDLYIQTQNIDSKVNSSQINNCRMQELSTQTEKICVVIEVSKCTLTSITEKAYGVDQCDISTQYDNVCEECLKRDTKTKSLPHKNGLLSQCWDSLKGTLHVFTLICFILAILLLYNVVHYSMSSRRCVRPTSSVPWDWMTLADILSLVFRIEYVGEVPM